jgi:hypothetical protein
LKLKCSWTSPAAIVYGTPLSTTQLNATAYQLNGTTALDGSFVYSPAAGTVLTVGSRQLSVTFTPIDTANYTSTTRIGPQHLANSNHYERFNFSKDCKCFRRVSVRLRIFMVICLAGLSSTRLHGQAEATASRAGDLQIGTMFNLANSDYRPAYFKGFGFYSTYDFRYHVGIEGEFHQANDQNTTEGIYERTYEIGPRFVLHYGRFAPYTRVMYVFSPTCRPYSEILKSGPSQIWPTTYSLSTAASTITLFRP